MCIYVKKNILLSYVNRYVRSFFVLAIIDGILTGLVTAYTSVIFIKIIFDRIEKLVAFKHILLIILISVIFYLLYFIYHNVFICICLPKAKIALQEKMQGELYQIAVKKDLNYYDNHELLNDFVWAAKESDTRAIAYVEDIRDLTNKVISSVTVFVLVFTIDWIILLSILLFVTINIIVKLWQTKMQFSADLQIAPFARRIDYINRVFHIREYSKEIRLGNALHIFLKQFHAAVNKILDIIHAYGKKKLLLTSGRNVATALFFDVLIILLLVYKLVEEKSITLGDFGASIGATWRMLRAANEIFDYVQKFREHNLYIQKFAHFVNAEPQICTPVCPVKLEQPIETIAIENVKFSYANSKKPVLNGISLQINVGEKVALVGYNGAGKSTLIKLLLRLYDPDEGQIKINGIDIRDLDLDEYRNRFSVVLQNYQLYATTLAENVLMMPYNKNDREIVYKALRKVGLNRITEKSENDINTQITREFDDAGILLSGGEKQKIAISRIFASPKEVLVLDEPSASLDAISEYSINQTILQEAKSKMLIFISHRLSTVQTVDKIYMFADGKIVEQGSHNELMRQNGRYAKMFNIQADKYNENRGK